MGKSSDDALKIVNTTGFSNIRYAFPKLLSEFIFQGIKLIQKKNIEIFSKVDCVIVVSQSYDQRIPSISTRVQSKLKLKAETFCIDIMDGCAGYIKAIQLAKMLEKNGHKKALVIAGDLHSSMTINSDIGTKVLFGDGISITTLETDESSTYTEIFNDGDNDNIISCSVKDNVINMKGFEVFKFASDVAPKIINSYLDKTGQTLKSFDLVALHQASKMLVSTICRNINYTNTLGDDFACNEIGNIGVGSIGAWLSKIDKLEKKGRLKMLAVGFGSGLSWGLASIVVDVNKNEAIYI